MRRAKQKQSSHGVLRHGEGSRWWCWKVLWIGLVVALLCVGGYRWIHATRFRVRQVNMTGSWQHLKQHHLQVLVEPYVHKPLWLIDMGHLQRVLHQSPWVDRVVIHRVWPDTLVMHFTERKPFARWRAHGLLTREGVLFCPSVLPDVKGLPWLWGSEQMQHVVWHRYQSMTVMLQPLSMQIERVVCDKNGAWQVSLTSGLQIFLGSRDILARLRRFVLLYPQIMKNRKTDVKQVDLRYTNGLSVR